MIYSFRQNNSGGFYCQPAKYIIVSGASDSEHATEIAMQAGMYLQGVAAGSDCSCCGDRWNGVSNEFDTVEDAIRTANDWDTSDNDYPQYIVVDDLDVADTILE